MAPQMAIIRVMVAGTGTTVTQYICDDRHSDLPGSVLYYHCTVVVPVGGAFQYLQNDLGPLNGGPIFS